MKFLLAVVAACAIVAISAQTPIRPKISEHFAAEGDSMIRRNDTHMFGRGIWAIDVPAQKSVEKHEFHEHHWFLYLLRRFDTHEEYMIDGHSEHDMHKCHHRAENGTMPEVWNWVSQAKFIGKKEVRSRLLDLWEYTTAGVKLFVAVHDSDVNTPVWFGRESANEEFNIIFERFESKFINQSWFDVPPQCQEAPMEPAHDGWLMK
mmetsp:Transcript_6783/g.15676  ORF Transcript_6783/g.15676 Transcript_6783/m.15676 type:complete len:205 (-) Transcript_6783:22-636(-)